MQPSSRNPHEYRDADLAFPTSRLSAHRRFGINRNPALLVSVLLKQSRLRAGIQNKKHRSGIKFYVEFIFDSTDCPVVLARAAWPIKGQPPRTDIQKCNG